MLNHTGLKTRLSGEILGIFNEGVLKSLCGLSIILSELGQIVNATSMPYQVAFSATVYFKLNLFLVAYGPRGTL